jgi:hypothetical protein
MNMNIMPLIVSALSIPIMTFSITLKRWLSVYHMLSWVYEFNSTLRVIMLGVIMLGGIMLSGIILIGIMLCGIMLSGIMLSVILTIVSSY